VSNQSKATPAKYSFPSPSKACHHPTFSSNGNYLRLIYRQANKKENKETIFNFYLESISWNTSQTNTLGALHMRS